MLEKVNTVLNSTTAFKIISLLQKRKVKGKGFMYVTDPFVPSKRLHIEKLGIMEPNQLGFGAGTWLDFYAYATSQDYAKALKSILASLGQEELVSNEDLHGVAAVLFANRVVVETLLKSRSNVMRAAFAQKVRLFVRSRSLQPEYTKNIAFCMQGDALNYFSDLIFQFYHPKKAPDTHFQVKAAYMCVPYFVNHYLVDHIDVYDMKGKFPKKFTTLQFFDSKFSFSNIWSSPLHAVCIHVFKNYETLLGVAEKHYNYGDYVGFTDVNYNPAGVFHEMYLPMGGIYYPQTEEDI